MSALFSIAAGTLTSLALGGAILTLARRLQGVERQEPAAAEPTPPIRGGRSSRPMLSALYAEPAPSPFASLMSVPAAPWLGAALALALITAATSRQAPDAAPARAASSDSLLVRLQGRVDSLAVLVDRLRDSVRIAAVVVPRAAAPVTRLARRDAAAATVLPAAPPPPSFTAGAAPSP